MSAAVDHWRQNVSHSADASRVLMSEIPRRSGRDGGSPTPGVAATGAALDRPHRLITERRWRAVVRADQSTRPRAVSAETR